VNEGSEVVKSNRNTSSEVVAAAWPAPADVRTLSGDIAPLVSLNVKPETVADNFKDRLLTRQSQYKQVLFRDKGLTITIATCLDESEGPVVMPLSKAERVSGSHQSRIAEEACSLNSERLLMIKEQLNEEWDEMMNQMRERPLVSDFKLFSGSHFDRTDDPIIIDGGCTSHMTSDPRLFEVIYECFGEVELPDKGVVKYIGKGKIGLLENVLWVPGINGTYISEGKLDKEGYEILKKVRCFTCD
jgi:hypothetical protein